jgi:hypothetical protein
MSQLTNSLADFVSFKFEMTYLTYYYCVGTCGFHPSIHPHPFAYSHFRRQSLHSV